VKARPPRRDVFGARTPERAPQDGDENANDTDPTDPLPNNKRHGVYHTFSKEAVPYAHRLREHGVLIVGCDHAGCTLGASLELLGHPALGDGLRERWVAKHDHPLDVLLNGRLRSMIGRTASEAGGRNVVLHFSASTARRLEEVRDALEARGAHGYDIKDRFYVIIELTGEAWRGFAAAPVPAPLWAIDARPHLLLHHGTTEQALAARLEQIAAAQKKKILPSDGGELLIDLEKHLLAGTLDSLLTTPEGTVPVTPPNEEALARDLLRTANEVEKAALFVAATFPKMRIGEYAILMQTLLPHLPPVEGATRRQPSRTAAEYWSAEQERIFERLRLGHETSVEGTHQVVFTFPGLKEALGRAFFPPYELAQIERLHAAGLLLNPGTPLHPGTPPRVVDALIEITARLAPSYPDVFHRGWLMNQLRKIEQWGAEFAVGTTRVVQAASGAALDWSGLLAELREHHRARHRTLLGRLAAMCRGFLATEATAPIARGFLDDLTNATKPDCEDVLEVIRRLRDQEAPSFDADARLRSLLDFVSVELRAEIFRELLERMRGPGGQPEPMAGWRTLELVATWFPAETEYDRMGEGARWALAFPYSVWESYRRWCLGHGGRESDTPIAWLQPHPGLPSPGERLRTLAAWLAHPAFCLALNHVLKSTLGERDSAYWQLLDLYFQPRYTVGEAFLAELLAGFYMQSGQPEILDLADRVAAKLPRSMLDKLRVLIRQGSEVSGEDLRRATKEHYPILKRRIQRAYDLASHLGGTNAKPSTP
jgi:hypothetical protein